MHIRKKKEEETANSKQLSLKERKEQTILPYGPYFLYQFQNLKVQKSFSCGLITNCFFSGFSGRGPYDTLKELAYERKFCYVCPMVGTEHHHCDSLRNLGGT